jgi:mRNA-degrading endonuclease RelE of RelBE toxin-antitoxin system
MVKRPPPQLLIEWTSYRGKKFAITHDAEINNSVQEACIHIHNPERVARKLKVRLENHADGLPAKNKAICMYGDIARNTPWGRIRSDDLRLYFYIKDGTIFTTHCSFKNQQNVDKRDEEKCRNHYDKNK